MRNLKGNSERENTCDGNVITRLREAVSHLTVMTVQLSEGDLVRRNSRSKLSFKRRYRKFAWIFGASAIVIAPLYWEQAAALYVLSTLAMCALLLVVMFSRLEARDKELHEVALKQMDTARGVISE